MNDRRACPRCTYPLPPGAAARCGRCAGTFVEVAAQHGLLGGGIADLRAQATHVGGSRLRCANGHGAMTAFTLGVHAAHVEIDACGTCGALWLDQWEGARLKRSLADAPQRSTGPTYEQEETKRGVGWYLFQLFSGLPVEVWNPVRQTPVIVYALLLACVGVYAREVVDPASADAYALVPAQLAARPWTLITHAFLHAGVLHLLGNMWFLWVFGDNIEDTLGRPRFVVIYLVATIAAALAQVASAPSSTIPLVGASGAIAGLMGAYLVTFPAVKVWMVVFFIRFKLGVFWYLGFWAAFQALLAFAAVRLPGYGTHGGVAFFAHVGGFVAGVACALWMRRSVSGR